jgi:hypothetical protein
VVSVSALPARERTTGTHWIGAGWVSKLMWSNKLEEKSFASAGHRAPFMQSVVGHYTD